MRPYVVAAPAPQPGFSSTSQPFAVLSFCASGARPFNKITSMEEMAMCRVCLGDDSVDNLCQPCACRCAPISHSFTCSAQLEAQQPRKPVL